MATALAAPPTGQGPRSGLEAKLLLDQGQKAFEQGNWRESILQLTRLVERYPSADGALDAHWTIGRAHLRLGEPEAALKRLKHFVLARSLTIDGVRASVDVGRAQLLLKRHHEAYLTSVELLSPRKGAPQAPAEVRIEALTLKARALTELGRDDRARQTIDSAKRELESFDPSPDIRSGLARIEVTLLTRACARFPSKGPLPEAQVRDQLVRRGLCLLEALPALKGAFAPEPSPSPSPQPAPSSAETLQTLLSHARESADRIAQAFRDYRHACAHPPRPPGKRTAIELKRYQEELADRLLDDCGKQLSRAAELLEPWKSALPSDRLPELEKILHAITRK